jgi:hypothetical protein
MTRVCRNLVTNFFLFEGVRLRREASNYISTDPWHCLFEGVRLGREVSSYIFTDHCHCLFEGVRLGREVSN